MKTDSSPLAAFKGLIRQKDELMLEDLFVLLDGDLTRAYGRPFSWKKITELQLTPEERLSAHILDARQGDGPQGEILWQTVLQQVFPMVRQLYLALSLKERMRFNTDFSTLFFSHAAPMPMINAEKILALMKSGIVAVRRSAQRTLFNKEGRVFSFAFQDRDGKRKHATHDYVVDARGQGIDFRRNRQTLAENLLNSGTVEIEPFNPKIAAADAVPLKERHRPSLPEGEGTGSVWIDPHTHRIRRTGFEGESGLSKTIYAVGAMTRGQIIDASMAHGIAVSTEIVAMEWIKQIFFAR